MPQLHSSTLYTYHSEVMQAMCSQLAGKRSYADSSDDPIPLAKKIAYDDDLFAQNLEQEMARRVKADRVLQDLSSDKSRQQARAKETARRNKWAKTIISSYPSEAAKCKVLSNDVRRVHRQVAI